MTPADAHPGRRLPQKMPCRHGCGFKSDWKPALGAREASHGRTRDMRTPAPTDPVPAAIRGCGYRARDGRDRLPHLWVCARRKPRGRGLRFAVRIPYDDCPACHGRSVYADPTMGGALSSDGAAARRDREAGVAATSTSAEPTKLEAKVETSLRLGRPAAFSIPDLAERTGRSTEAVEVAVSRLLGRGRVVKKSRGRGRRVAYTVPGDDGPG